MFVFMASCNTSGTYDSRLDCEVQCTLDNADTYGDLNFTGILGEAVFLTIGGERILFAVLDAILGEGMLFVI